MCACRASYDDSLRARDDICRVIRDFVKFAGERAFILPRGCICLADNLGVPVLRTTCEEIDLNARVMVSDGGDGVVGEVAAAAKCDL